MDCLEVIHDPYPDDNAFGDHWLVSASAAIRLGFVVLSKMS